MALTVESPSFRDGEPIPDKYAHDYDNVSPPVRWRGEPDGTRSFAVLMSDPDAPDPRAPKRTFCHWVVYNIPAIAHELPEDASRRSLPSGAEQGMSDFHEPAYGGPKPPVGTHRYELEVFALDTVLPEQTYERGDLLRAIDGHVLDSGKLTGTFDAQRTADERSLREEQPQR